VSKGTSFGVFVMLMRMARLLRIARLFRLVKIIRPLYNLAMGILEALQGMFWVLIFTFMVLYGAGIICTRTIGHGTIFGDADLNSDVEDVRKMFNSVGDSMYTLFEIMSGWSLQNVSPMLNAYPWMKIVFVLFIIHTSWALLSVMTGVVSENMIAIREQVDAENRDAHEMVMKELGTILLSLFNEIDADGSGTVDKKEFEALFNNPAYMKRLNNAGFSSAISGGIRVRDLLDVFDILDADKSGELNAEEFLEGFYWLLTPVTGKSILRLESNMRQVDQRIHQALEQLSKQIIEESKNDQERSFDLLQELLEQSVAMNTGTRKTIASLQARLETLETNVAPLLRNPANLSKTPPIR
jgi:hypothetical protein